MEELADETSIRMEVIFHGEIVEVELPREEFHDRQERAAMTRRSLYEILVEDLETAIILDEETTSDDWTS